MWKRYIYAGNKTNYLVSENGQVFSENSNKILSQFKNNGGYVNVHIHINGKDIKKGVHCLVAETFIPNPNNLPQVNHKDGNKENNNVSNLEWVTQSDNNLHAIKMGLRKPISGEAVHFAKYTENQVNQACKEIERDELDLDEIEKLTGIPVKTLGEIRSGKIWKDISKHYIFPKEKTIKSKIGLNKKQRKQIKRLVHEGKSNKEIYKITGLTRNKKISKMMTDLRMKWKFQNIMSEDQRPSKTQEPYCIEEELVYKWEP